MDNTPTLPKEVTKLLSIFSDGDLLNEFLRLRDFYLEEFYHSKDSLEGYFYRDYRFQDFSGLYDFISILQEGVISYRSKDPSKLRAYIDSNRHVGDKFFEYYDRLKKIKELGLTREGYLRGLYNEWVSVRTNANSFFHNIDFFDVVKPKVPHFVLEFLQSLGDLSWETCQFSIDICVSSIHQIFGLESLSVAPSLIQHLYLSDTVKRRGEIEREAIERGLKDYLERRDLFDKAYAKESAVENVSPAGKEAVSDQFILAKNLKVGDRVKVKVGRKTEDQVCEVVKASSERGGTFILLKDLDCEFLRISLDVVPDDKKFILKN